jgi:hypothetical protein
MSDVRNCLFLVPDWTADTEYSRDWYAKLTRRRSPVPIAVTYNRPWWNVNSFPLRELGDNGHRMEIPKQRELAVQVRVLFY